MPSAIWTGSISFGLVSVPVRLVSATRSRDVRFNQLENGTNARIRYRKVSEATGEEVPNDDIVKGYEVSPSHYVVVDDEEIQSLQPKASRMIDIEEFVDLDEIDPIFFEQPYYLIPDKDVIKPYKLLVEAMTELRKVAIGRIIMRSKERLVAIRPMQGVLCIETMRYADEVLEVPDVGLDDVAEPNSKELAMARQLIEALAADFAPDQFHDEYRDQLLALIERKAAGEEIVAEPVVEAPGKVVDLMAALEASLARASAAGEARSDERARPAKARKAGAKKATAKSTRSTRSPAKRTRTRKSA